MVTGELRTWIAKHHYLVEDVREIISIADRIDDECERRQEDLIDETLGGFIKMTDENMAKNGWIRLPKDSDGEYIHIGDVMEGYGKTIEVVELRYGRSGWVLISRDGNGYADTFAFAHHHKPTVEDVLREFTHAILNQKADYREQNITEYAQRLQLREAGE